MATTGITVNEGLLVFASQHPLCFLSREFGPAGKFGRKPWIAGHLFRTRRSQQAACCSSIREQSLSM
jgi:hypothetical protein